MNSNISPLDRISQLTKTIDGCEQALLIIKRYRERGKFISESHDNEIKLRMLTATSERDEVRRYISAKE